MVRQVFATYKASFREHGDQAFLSVCYNAGFGAGPRANKARHTSAIEQRFETCHWNGLVKSSRKKKLPDMLLRLNSTYTDRVVTYLPQAMCRACDLVGRQSQKLPT